MALGLAVVLGPVGKSRTGGQMEADPPDVILVTIDTLRADHVGCYGYASAQTPTIDALARSGVRFTHHQLHDWARLSRPA